MKHFGLELAEVPERSSYDAIVIGGGHNGLVTAAYLARGGLDVCVLERRDVIGGATLTEEPFEGYRYSVFSYLVSLLRPQVIHELDLVRHGLMLLPTETTLNPLPGRDCLLREVDPLRTRHNIARHSARDAEAYPEFKLAMHHMAEIMLEIQDVVPPELRRLGVQQSELPEALLDLGRSLTSRPKGQLEVFLRMLTASAEDFLGYWFESEALCAALSTSSIIGSFLSPRTPGSAYVLLHHYMGEVDGAYRAWGFQKGGSGGVAATIARAAQSLGAEIVVSSPVERVLIEQGRAAGVVTTEGREIRASTVLSSLVPQLSLGRLVDGEIDDEAGEKASRWNSRGCSGKVNLALDGPPSFECLPEVGPHLAGGVSIAPSIDYIDRAYNQAKYGEPSSKPFIDLLIPSAIDPDMAPPGKHVLSCFVQYAPYELKKGSWDDERERFGDAVIDVLEEYMPGIKGLILHRQVLVPPDIERIAGIVGGNIFHGELILPQLFYDRPARSAASYATSIDGYYLCGSSSHPGGGISGGPGRLAARAALADLEGAS